MEEFNTFAETSVRGERNASDDVSDLMSKFLGRYASTKNKKSENQTIYGGLLGSLNNITIVNS